MKAILTSILLTGATAASLSAQELLVTNRFEFVVQNPTYTQLSGRPFEYHLWSVAPVYANYTASSGHCSPVRMHFYIDGTEKAVSGALEPGEESGFLDLGPVSAGAHMLSLRGEGIPVGCNLGYLSNWGGVVEVARAARACDFEWLDVELSGQDLILSWPALPCNFVLQMKPTLTDPVEWETVLDEPVLVEDRYTLTTPVGNSSAFYRLVLR
ncbi:MAG TPA: hypothetical protein VMZ27_03545 [Candidatus Saccharimonadales bacterium]|nr:hypothetical protein [Candidatus Saccharimonadales bacterium]